MKISKKDLDQKIIALIVTVFATAASMIVYVLPSSTLRFVILLFLFVLVLYSAVKNGLRVSKKSFIVLALAMVYFFNNYFVKHGMYAPVLTYLSLLLLCIVSEHNINWARYTLKMCRWVYVFYAVCTIAFYFMPSFYIGRIVPLFPSAANQLKNLYWRGSMAGLTSHYSTNAMLITVGLIMESVQLLGQRKKNYCLTVVMAVALLLTSKRGHIVFFAMAFYLLLYFYNSDKKKSRFFNMIGIALAVLVVGSILVTVFPVLGNFIVRFQETAASGDVTQNRMIFWNMAIKWFREHLLLGIGWCQFQSRCLETTQYSAHVHNVYLQLLCETGIVGFIAYLWWMGSNLLSTINLYKGVRSKDYTVTKEDEYLLTFSLCFQMFFLLYCVTGNPLYDEEMYIPYLISCAVCIFFKRRKRSLM